jgi:hypothetical protein
MAMVCFYFRYRQDCDFTIQDFCYFNYIVKRQVLGTALQRLYKKILTTCRCRLRPGKGGRRLRPSALFKEKHCALATFYKNTSLQLDGVRYDCSGREYREIVQKN